MSPKVLLAGGGVGVLLGVGLIVGGFWKAPWQVVPGFLCCVVGVSIMLWRFSRVMAVLGGLLLAVLITFVASLPFGGIGQVWKLSWWRFGYVKSVPPGTAFDTAALPELPLGYQYLKEAGEEIDMVPYVVPEKEGTTTRRFDVFAKEGGRDTADIVIDAEGAPPTRWKTSGVIISSERHSLPVGRIIVSDNWLESSEGSANILFDAVPRRFQQGHLVSVLQSGVATMFERDGFDVRTVRVGIVARGKEGIAGKSGSVVLMWVLEGKARESGERKTVYALAEYADNVGVLKGWVCMARDQGWRLALSRDEFWAGQKTETGKPDVASQPTVGAEGVPVEPAVTPPPVAEKETAVFELKGKEEKWLEQDAVFEEERQPLRKEATRSTFQNAFVKEDFPEGCIVDTLGGDNESDLLFRKDLPPALFDKEGNRSSLREEICSYIRRAQVMGDGKLTYYPCFQGKHCVSDFSSTSLPLSLIRPTPTPTVNPFRPAGGE